MQEYHDESNALDRRVLEVIETWHRGNVVKPAAVDLIFFDMARYQYRYNQAYRRYVDYLGFDLSHIDDVRQIPAVPAAAFKDAALTTGDPDTAAAVFQTSGTTAKRRGKHFMESTKIYEASALAIFDRLVLAPRDLLGSQTRQLRILSMVPNALERSDSSLAFMVEHLIRQRGDGQDRQLLSGDYLDLAELRASTERAQRDGATLCIFTTALAAMNMLENLADERLPLPVDSIVIETGGFKGRTKTITQSELYDRLAACFCIERSNIFAEFGMTELTSQYYDLASSCSGEPRIKAGPPWLRSIVIDADGNEVPAGKIGALRHLDLANRSSVAAIDTEDLAQAHGGGFILLGRQTQAELRGCSLDAENLTT